MSLEKTDEDWDFNWMGTLECHVVITELDDEIEVQHDKGDKRSNVEQDVNIATEDEHVEPKVDQTNVMTEVQDDHVSLGDYNVDEPLVDQLDHIDFNWEEPVLSMVGEQPTEQPVDEATEQPLHQGTEHIECNWDKPAVDNVHFDYGLSDELESLNSDEDADEPRPRIREPIFNAKTDIADPRFALGMIFETMQVLRVAFVEYSIKNGRPIHYVKNDTTRVWMRCKHPCSWKMYAAVQEDKLTFKVNKLVDNHTCTVVSKNMWATSSYLSKKFEGSFRSNPEWRYDSFTEAVKSDCMVDVSVHQYYRARKRCFEVIKENTADQYKMLWDYCEELKRTNEGSTVELSATRNVFKRLYICLRACKKRFKDGCRPFIGLDGCHLKGEFKGQLLTALGIDGDNSMFSIAYAIVENENRES
ncbi:Uncharacterized protein Adt_14280 [Abeliophyllum distichum]|uniref:Transposase MuDR plant domain-containing protein n=1 Tax=Abeliophyllum distichum TaxID=126358 RepID=A0ABD1TZQ7_9LAMI